MREPGLTRHFMCGGALVVRYGEQLRQTLTCLTGGGGTHYYFTAPAGIAVVEGANKLGPGVDVKAAGGYVLLPPSIHISGRRYTWEVGVDDA